MVSSELVCVDDSHTKKTSLLKLDKIRCKVHNKEIIGFCIDEKCKEKNKFACPKCIFKLHNGHIFKDVEELNNLIEIENKDYEGYLKEFNKNKTNIKKVIDQFEKD
eukprot:jgi/Orpsp1_1/1191269/evm.model.d7180000084580.1